MKKFVQSGLVFDFESVLLFASLFFGNTIDILYFMKNTVEGVSVEDLSDPMDTYFKKRLQVFT